MWAGQVRALLLVGISIDSAMQSRALMPHARKKHLRSHSFM